MTCFNPVPLYHNPAFAGLVFAGSQGDGYGIQLRWLKAFSRDTSFNVAYNVYYSTVRDDVFTEGVKFVITNSTQTTATVKDLIPGKVYYFAVRATLYDPNLLSINDLPSTPNESTFKIYSEGALTSNITDEDLEIPITDIDTFPPFGVVQIGAELISYNSLNFISNTLMVATRGLYGTEPRLHTTDGYDGYRTYDNPLVRIFTGWEEINTAVILEENKFDYPKMPWTSADGYKEKTEDLLNSDLSAHEEDKESFPAFDFSSYRRTDPADLLAGHCVGSYFGGEYYCADGYNGIGFKTRGIAVDEINNQREEVLLSLTGVPCVLLRRKWTGKTCRCVTSSREQPEYNCPLCFGSGFITGYEQYYNPRRSDGRIIVRFDPTAEMLEPQESGLENVYKPNCWTLTVPVINSYDILIRFNKDGIEEFRYRVLNVTRNATFLENLGAQKMSVARIRKTDRVYQIPSFRNTATMPEKIQTSISSVSGSIPPHSHTITINENILSITQINQLTEYSQGHNHIVRAGEIIDTNPEGESLGHTHQIIL